MKVNKSQALLYIFDKLLNEKHITKEEILDELEISELTFKRYIQELRAFLCNFYQECELVYSKSNKSYFLKRGVAQ